jgi:hypothetical protein
MAGQIYSRLEVLVRLGRLAPEEDWVLVYIDLAAVVCLGDVVML